MRYGNLDIKELTERVDDLRSARDDFVIESPDGEETPNPDGWTEENTEDAEELSNLESLLDELGGYGDDFRWEGSYYPATLIHDNNISNYLKEFIEEVGDLPRNIPSYIVIDWDATVDNLKEGWSEVDYDGETYWYRDC